MEIIKAIAYRIFLVLLNFAFGLAMFMWMTMGGILITAIAFACVIEAVKAVFILFFLVAIPAAALFFGKQYSAVHMIMRNPLLIIIVVTLPGIFIGALWGLEFIAQFFGLSISKPGCG